MNKRKLGTEYEDKAIEYLKTHNYKILEKNFRAHRGEVDIIALEGNCLVFIEVKYRKGNRFGYSAEAVDIQKQKTLYYVANVYILSHRQYENTPSRFDVIGFDGNKMTHIKNAFGSI